LEGTKISGIGAMERDGQRTHGQGSDGGFRPSFPLVETKLHPPLIPEGAVSRRRLIDRLTSEAHRPIVSIVAPGGYGKTILLAEWASRDPDNVAWLTIDDYDNDASTLLSYLAAAIDRVSPLGDSLAGALSATGSQILRAAVPRLAAALFAWQPPGLLVIDDVHKIHDPTCLMALSTLLDHLPPDFRVALAARHPPDLSLDRLRANRSLEELRPKDLALDEEETAALVAGVGARVTPDEARALAARSEGWAAAIYLATLDRLSSTIDMGPAAYASGRDELIAGYLQAALEPELDDDDRTLLTRTSILGVIEPGVAEAVAGTPGAADRLRSLARKNQLIVRLAGPVESYRYHHLLSDYLRQQLERREPEAIAGLHRRAATWYVSAGRSELAIEHAFDAGDSEGAARLFAAVAVFIHYRGRDDLLDRLLARFSPEQFEEYPRLATLAGWLHGFQGRAEAADRMAEIADRSTDDGTLNDGAATFASSRALLNAMLMRHGIEDALDNALIAVAAERPESAFRTSALNELATVRMLEGHGDAADAIWVDAIASADATGGVPYLPLACRAALAIERGDWKAADRLARRSHEVLEHSTIGLISTTLLVHAVNARVAMHHGDRRRVGEELAHGQLVRPQVSYAMPAFAVWSMLELAKTYLAIADPAGARAVVSEAERIVRRRPDLGVLNGQLIAMRRQLDDAARTMSGPSTLTPAELRLLPLLSTYLSLEEIGERLTITRHTVKAHALSIYGKLDASTRSQAVERAIEIGLLEPFPGLGLGARAR
jgi:LuxR family maltose regulon positive regulatory protein